MSDAFCFIQRSGRHHYEFFDELKKIGVELKDEYVSEAYTGESFQLDYRLIFKKGLFSKDLILGSNDKSDLDTVKDYIGYFPHLKGLLVERRPLTVNSGNFALKHVSKMVGLEGNHQVVEEIVHSWGGGKEAVDYIFNGIEETLLGFFPFTDQNLVKSYVDLVNAGAFREATPEDIAATQDLVSKYAKRMKDR